MKSLVNTQKKYLILKFNFWPAGSCPIWVNSAPIGNYNHLVMCSFLYNLHWIAASAISWSMKQQRIIERRNLLSTLNKELQFYCRIRVCIIIQILLHNHSKMLWILIVLLVLTVDEVEATIGIHFWAFLVYRGCWLRVLCIIFYFTGQRGLPKSFTSIRELQQFF